MTLKETQKPVTFYLDESAYSWLTKDAQHLQVSRSAYLRNIVEWWRKQREASPANDLGPALGPELDKRHKKVPEKSDELLAARQRILELEAQVEGHDELTRQLSDSQVRVTVLEGDVRELSAEKQGMQNLLDQQRERQGMSDSLSIELSQQLKFALTTVDRLTLALPAPEESSNSKGFNWRFWRR